MWASARTVFCHGLDDLVKHKHKSNLTSYDASSFVPLDSALDMELTPEARLILEQHLNIIRTPMKKL
jgi:hypothetical protein